MFKSNEELFCAVNELIANLEKHGSISAVQELKKGFQSINGLTDGWALFLESIESVQNSTSGRIDPNDLDDLQSIYETVYFAVYRKKLKPWWQLG
jgi:hypothetical protein